VAEVKAEGDEKIKALEESKAAAPDEFNQEDYDNQVKEN
jgi:hypothetical protein